MSQTDQWYLSGPGGGQRSGPFRTDEVLAKAREEGLSPKTLCWRDGMAEWRPLAEVKPFAKALRGPGTTRRPWRSSPAVAIGGVVIAGIGGLVAFLALREPPVFRQARLLQKTGQYEEAARAVVPYLKSHPDDREGLYLFASSMVYDYAQNGCAPGERLSDRLARMRTALSNALAGDESRQDRARSDLARAAAEVLPRDAPDAIDRLVAINQLRADLRLADGKQLAGELFERIRSGPAQAARRDLPRVLPLLLQWDPGRAGPAIDVLLPDVPSEFDIQQILGPVQSVLADRPQAKKEVVRSLLDHAALQPPMAFARVEILANVAERLDPEQRDRVLRGRHDYLRKHWTEESARVKLEEVCQGVREAFLRRSLPVAQSRSKQHFRLWYARPDSREVEVLLGEDAIRGVQAVWQPVGEAKPCPDPPQCCVHGSIGLARCGLASCRVGDTWYAAEALLVAVREGLQWQLVAIGMGDCRLTSDHKYNPESASHREIASRYEQVGQAIVSKDADRLVTFMDPRECSVAPLDQESPLNVSVTDRGSLMDYFRQEFVKSTWQRFDTDVEFVKVSSKLALALTTTHQTYNDKQMPTTKAIEVLCLRGGQWQSVAWVSGDWTALLSKEPASMPPLDEAVATQAKSETGPPLSGDVPPALAPTRVAGSSPPSLPSPATPPKESPAPYRAGPRMTQEEPEPSPRPRSTTITTKSDLQEILRSLDVHRVIWVQLNSSDLTEEQTQKLHDWVEQGGVIWLDTDLAKHFAFPLMPAPSERKPARVNVLVPHDVLEGVPKDADIGYTLSSSNMLIVGDWDKLSQQMTPLVGWAIASAPRDPRKAKMRVVGGRAWVVCAERKLGRGVAVFRPRQFDRGSLAPMRLEENLTAWSFRVARPPAAEHKPKPTMPTATELWRIDPGIGKMVLGHEANRRTMAHCVAPAIVADTLAAVPKI